MPVDFYTSIDKNHTGGDSQVFGKYGIFIGPAIPICIFTDLNLIITYAILVSYRIGIIDRFDDPKPSPLIPGHGNGIDNIRFGGEQFQFESNRYLNQFFRFFRRKWSWN